MKTSPRSLTAMITAAIKDFGADECGVRAAALAYYTVFALPPLLILLILVAGTVWDPQDVQHALESQFAGLMGASGASQIRTIIARADRPGSDNVFRTVASVAGLLFGATGAFVQLQGALNRAWGVKPDPERGGVMQFVTKRLFSLGMVLGIGFLLAVSLALTSAVSAMGGRLGSGVAEPVLHGLNFLGSLLVLGLLFAAMFKVLPDAEIAWRDVRVGAAVTALLFVAGKFAIGLYLGRSSPGDAFGAAGALAVVLIWTYYSGVILLLGAEFTKQWARQRGSGIEPEEGAVRIVEHEEHIRPDEPGARDARGGADGDRGAGGRRDVAAMAGGAPAGRVSLGQALLGLPVFLWLTRRRK